MVYDKIVLGTCLLLLLVIHAALAAARKRGDQHQPRVLHLFRLGLSLSATSYLLRLTDMPRGHSSALVFIIGSSGTIFLWLGFMEHWRLRAARLDTLSVPNDEQSDEQSEPIPEALLTVFPAVGSSPLTARAHQALLHAQYEAYRWQVSCVDTDHLLLGLLHDSRSAGVHLLDVLGASPEKVHLELLGRMGVRRGFTKAEARPVALTDRAEQVLALAAQEAHRFDKACVGTEHLILGLVLVGKGKAAAVLFEGGITVDDIRAEIIKAKRAA